MHFLNDTGNIRESFFINQVRIANDVITSSVADFKVGDNTFEVGGENKKQKQIQGVDNAFVVKYYIETGYMNVLPLWQFGLLY